LLKLKLAMAARHLGSLLGLVLTKHGFVNVSWSSEGSMKMVDEMWGKRSCNQGVPIHNGKTMTPCILSCFALEMNSLSWLNGGFR
jgi:hypothetical protein